MRPAPSAGNAKPWKLIMADDTEIKDRVARATFSQTFSLSQTAAEAPVIAAATLGKHSVLAQWLAG
jgi:nitroreductase